MSGIAAAVPPIAGASVTLVPIVNSQIKQMRTSVTLALAGGYFFNFYNSTIEIPQCKCER